MQGIRQRLAGKRITYLLVCYGKEPDDDGFWAVCCFARLQAVGWVLRCVYLSKSVRKNGIFEPFIYNNEHFTKTGSGQT